ncbi:MAG: class B sortase [Lachnospiraceae bacterium]|nr:class B sortase [Lachnospiraceae bacterium]
MERKPIDDLQEITIPKDAQSHMPLPKKPEKSADMNSKVSALFAEPDFEEDILSDAKEIVPADLSKKTSIKPITKGEEAEAVPEKSLDVIPVKQRSVRSNPTRRKPATQVKPEVKPQVKPEVKPQVKPEVKPQVKPEVKPQVKPETKRKQAPETAQAKAEESQETLQPQIAEPENPKKKRKTSPRNLILTIIIILAACGLLFSGYKLFTIISGYKKGNDTYKEIEHIVKPAPSQEEEKFTVDVKALKEMNEDAQGYIYCKDVLSYPIVQCDNNDYYLTHLFNGEWNSCGCLFIDCNIPDGLEAKNCIIYGHNMNDGSMFASLYKYDDEAFYQTHKEFDVFTEGHHYIYKVFSLFVTPVDGFVYTTDFFSDEDFVNFLNVAADCCPYETEYGELTADRKVITMSTCLGNDDDAHRFVVMLIRDREVLE